MEAGLARNEDFNGAAQEGVGIELLEARALEFGQRRHQARLLGRVEAGLAVALVLQRELAVVVLAHRLASAVDQREQDLQRPAAQRHRLAVVEQDTLRAQHLKRTEREHLLRQTQPSREWLMATAMCCRRAAAKFWSRLRDRT